MGIFIKEQEQYLQKKLHDCGYDVEEVTLHSVIPGTKTLHK